MTWMHIIIINHVLVVFVLVYNGIEDFHWRGVHPQALV